MDLSDSYIHIYYLLEDLLSLALLIPNQHPNYDQHTVFHIYLLMIYVNSAAYFCITTDNIVEMRNISFKILNKLHMHPLKD